MMTRSFPEENESRADCDVEAAVVGSPSKLTSREYSCFCRLNMAGDRMVVPNAPINKYCRRCRYYREVWTELVQLKTRDESGWDPWLPCIDNP
jgi:hypothetical protein